MIKESTEVFIGFLLFLAIATYGGFSVGKYVGQINSRPARVGLNNTSTVNLGNNSDPTITGVSTFTVATIAEHNKAEDCWIVISNKIYSVSSYLNTHPGGAAIIIPYCGKDATQAFATKDGKGVHSALAQELLASFYIGTIGSEISTITSLPKPQQPAQLTSPSVTPPSVVSPPNNLLISLTTTEIAKHSSEADCWIIVNNGVYNVTNYLLQHPGGKNEIIPYCGKDATQGFATRGGTGQHSSAAQSYLAQLYLGPVGSAAAVTTNPPIVSSNTTSRDDDEYDDD